MPESVLVKRPGISWLQDAGRPGAARYGIPVNGAVDQYSAATANALVGNPPESPLIECTALPSSFAVPTGTLVAVTGAPADVSVDGRPVSQWTTVFVTEGADLQVSNIRHGVRYYIAIRGGFAAPLFMGSCAPDTVLGFGRRLEKGDQLGLRQLSPSESQEDLRALNGHIVAESPTFADDWTVPVTDGPDVLEFGESTRLLYDSDYVVTPHSNHVGLRLRGPLPRRATKTEVLSRGVPVGAVEVPAGDELLILHRGRGVTAGYPVLAVATSVGLSRLGQARPGQTVRFTRWTVAEAVHALREEHARVREIRAAVAAALAPADHRHSNLQGTAPAASSAFYRL